MMMRLRELWSTDRSFLSASDLKAYLLEISEPTDEKFLESEQLLIFSASRQRTWLVATETDLYCVFDMLWEEQPRIKWKLARAQMVDENNRLTLSIKTEDSSERSGLITIDKKKPRKYSKKLFTRMPIDRSMRLMLMKALNVAI